MDAAPAVDVGEPEVRAGDVFDGQVVRPPDRSGDERMDHVRVVRAGGQAGFPKETPLGVRTRVPAEEGELDGCDPARVPVPGAEHLPHAAAVEEDVRADRQVVGPAAQDLARLERGQVAGEDEAGD